MARYNTGARYNSGARYNEETGAGIDYERIIRDVTARLEPQLWAIAVIVNRRKTNP